MELDVFVLEFTYFDGAQWEMVTKEITALSHEQLYEQFLYETSALYETIYKDDKVAAKTPLDLWEQVKGVIRQEKLKFPLVVEK